MLSLLYTIFLLLLSLFFSCIGHHRALHSFPTRRSSDLTSPARPRTGSTRSPCTAARSPRPTDRKSTRLNSSHLVISYAVFCLKKKKLLTGHLGRVKYNEDHG